VERMEHLEGMEGRGGHVLLCAGAPHPLISLSLPCRPSHPRSSANLKRAPVGSLPTERTKMTGVRKSVSGYTCVRACACVCVCVRARAVSAAVGSTLCETANVGEVCVCVRENEERGEREGERGKEEERERGREGGGTSARRIGGDSVKDLPIFSATYPVVANICPPQTPAVRRSLVSRNPAGQFQTH
jgi:hypothetical protein